jgi:putative transport protein
LIDVDDIRITTCMDWLHDLIFNTEGSAHAILLVMVVSALGVALGQAIRFRGVTLGVAWVMFVGLAFSFFGLKAQDNVLHFLREFGLILFVFTIGLQVGPSFFASLKRNGLPLNLAAASIVIGGVGLAVLQWKLFFGGSVEHVPQSVGLLCGATTNTPSLAAGTAAFEDLARSASGTGPSAGATLAAAYAVAYPFGIVGVLLSMLAIRFLFRIDLAEENRRLAEGMKHPMLDVMNVEVVNPALAGRAIREIPTLGTSGVVMTRLLRDQQVRVAGADSILQLGDVVTAVGPSKPLAELELIIGRRSSVDARAVSSDIAVQRVLVSSNRAVGKTIEELAFREKFGVAITRINRGELELPVTPMARLQFGDRIVLVGEQASMNAVAAEVGDSRKALDKPMVLPLLIGIVLGVICGSIPIAVPGLSAPLKLGLAGGPLVVAILLSRLYKLGPIVWYMPNSANFMLREIGIVLFLASVGLLGGEKFVASLASHGFQWLAIAAVITVVPVFVVGVICRAIFKMNFITLSGLMAGSMTDPPALAFAQQMTGSDAPTISYATVYPMVMLLRVLSVQVMVLLLAG